MNAPCFLYLIDVPATKTQDMRCIALVLLFACLMWACNKDPLDTDVPDKPMEVSGADISNAYYLGYIPGMPGELSNNLFKVSGPDLPSEQLEVNFLDEYGDVLGDSISSVHVRHIISISPEYTVLIGKFEFELEGGLLESGALLLNTVTGAIHDLKGEFNLAANNTYMGSRYYQQDKTGSIYYYDSGMKRLVFSAEGEVSVERYMDYSFDSSDGYYLDPEGNIFFETGQRVKIASGGIQETGSRYLGFTGFDGKSYFLEGSLKPDMYLYTFSFDEGKLKKDTICEQLGYFESYYWELNHYADRARNNHILLAPNLMEDYYEEKFLAFGVLFSESEKQFYELSFPDIVPDNIEIYGLEDNYYWLRSKDNSSAFYLVDLDEYTLDSESRLAEFSSASEFIIPSTLEIRSIFFNEDRLIEFEAYDLQQEKKVKGFISAIRGLEYWELESTLGTTVLKRIR